MNDSPVIIVGGGLAGLSCALRLREHDIPCRVLEASDCVGGRVRTDRVDGFALDHGFQVLLTAYPAARELFDYQQLALGEFEPGAIIRCDGKFSTFSDPWRRPSKALATALAPVATLSDKLRIARLRSSVCRGSLSELFQRPETTTIARLQALGFSSLSVERFFRPFLGGIFLDRSLETSSRMFEFVFRMFTEGTAALPAGGMGALGEQLASKLAEGVVQCGMAVDSVARDHVCVAGESHPAAAVVLATDAATASRLAPEASELPSEVSWCGNTCFYFAAEKPPIDEPVLLINGEGQGPINTVCVPSLVADNYAPPGAALISVSVVGCSHERESALHQEVVEQLRSWFGPDAAGWQHLKTFQVVKALPPQPVGWLDPPEKTSVTTSGLFVCGDHRDSASIQGALASGRRAADAVAAAIGSPESSE